MSDFRENYRENVHRRVPDAFIRRYGGTMMTNEDAKDVVRFNKSSQNTDLLGISAQGGHFIYGKVKQLESFYGTTSSDDDQNLNVPTNLKLDENDFSDFSFQSEDKVVLLSMGGSLLSLDLTSKKVPFSFKNLGLSVFCSSSDSQDYVLIGNCMKSDLKLFDLRSPNCFKCISSVNNSIDPKRKIIVRKKLSAICHLGEKYFATGFSSNEKYINIWDLRYIKSNNSVQNLNLIPIKRDNFGVYSMKLDRTFTKLLAGCTDGCFREYCLLSGSSNPTNFYCGGLSGAFKRSFAFSPLTDHFVGPSKDGVGFWDFQETISWEDSLLIERMSTPKPSKTPSPNKMFSSPGLAGISPGLQFYSPLQSPHRQPFTFTKGRKSGLFSPKFNFKPWNESLQHCDWSSCGRYIAISTETNFTICDNESTWARNCANDDHMDLSKFSSFGIPLNLTFPSYCREY